MFTSRMTIKAVAEYEDNPGGRAIYRISYRDPVTSLARAHHCLGYIWDGEILRWFGYSRETLPNRLELTITVDAVETVELVKRIKKA